jgi:Lrp/AsnC family transcriptional regulator, leucine-responsive regulatory protein
MTPRWRGRFARWRTQGGVLRQPLGSAGRRCLDPQVATELDAVDVRLLRELKRNGRASHASLGAAVHLSRNAVRQRVERLERDGHIRGYTILEGAQGEPTVTAVLLIARHDRVRGSDVIDGLRSIPEVVACDVVSGELDLIVRLEARDTERVRAIWRQVADLPGVRDITTAISLGTVIDRR